jgi:transcriptional regulator with XRE-family HTH domain
MATPKDLPRDVGGFIRDLRRNAKISLRQLAEQAGVSNPYLSQIERGLRKPSAEVLQQLASALRVSTPMMYLRAGLLDSEGQPGVLAAIAADPDLTIAQKQSLSQIYETFRGENIRYAAPAAGEPATDTPTAAQPAATEALATAEPAAADVLTVGGPETTGIAPAPAAPAPADPVPGAPAPVAPTVRPATDEATRQAQAVLDAVAAVETGATPTPKPAKKATRRAATKAAPAAQEEK